MERTAAAPIPSFPVQPPRRWRSGPAASLLFAFLFAGSGAPPANSQGKPAAQNDGWIVVRYGELIDGRRLSHSGETVADLLRVLDGRPLSAEAADPRDRLRHALLDPLLEPFAFVLSDAVDAAAPRTTNQPWIEVGPLWHDGEAEPAWVELLRARAVVVESDGDGRMRVFAPLGSAGERATPRPAGALASRQAFDAAWPILRHVLAAERRRLAGRDGKSSDGDGLPIEVEARAFVHEPQHARFRLAIDPAIVRIESTAPEDARPPLDLNALARFLERGLQLEGGRLEPSGALRLFGSEPGARAGLLGRPIELSDLAVAYRAVFRGGLAEPYMSLDKGPAPHVSAVNYGGRLRNTALGLVSLQCDIRFKTFSLGIDAVTDQDVREKLRSQVPQFRSHLERLAADPRSKGIAGQQTRLWFYPDSVELTLSEAADAVVVRRARMTASSERVQEGAERRADPPWTLDTVAAINRDYERLGQFFPELLDLDQAARLLALFAWLKEADREGLPIPDLAALLAVELPMVPTPRSFPQLLALNALPPEGSAGPVDVFSRVPVEEALDRLLPAGDAPLPARRRFARALQGLDRTQADHAALARELEAVNVDAVSDEQLDFLSYRAERLRMHRLVLGTLPAATREQLAARGRGIRVFSVGIGGLDLGMSKSVERARERSRAAASGSGAESSVASDRRAASQIVADGSGAPVESAGLPAAVLPDHGGGDRPSPAAGGAPGVRSTPRAWLQSGSGRVGEEDVTWQLVVYGKDSPEPASRRLVFGRTRELRMIERVDRGRFVRYRMERDATDVIARTTARGLASPERPAEGDAPVPDGLALLQLPGGDAGAEETAGLPVRLRSEAGDREAAIPRPVVQRLVLGRDVDLLRDARLPGLGSPAELLGSVRHAMVVQDRSGVLAPWEGPGRVVPGEEMADRFARALAAWWKLDPEPAAVVVGTDRKDSPGRWSACPRPKGALLWAPDEAFVGSWKQIAAPLAAAWQGPRHSDPGTASRDGLVTVVVSAEPPGMLAERIRRIARDPAFRGRLLAVYSLAGPIRTDLPASLLAEKNLAGIGIAEAPPVGRDRVVQGLAEFSRGMAQAAQAGRRIEDIAGPFLWYF